MRALALAFALVGCQAVGTIGNNTPDPESTPTVQVATPPPTCDQPKLGRRLLRRLTRGEYDRTIEDLLGIRADFGARFAADTSVDGYDNHAEALVVSPLLADQLRLAAEELSARAVENISALTPCTAGDSCVTEFIQKFGERAFRRPLKEAEVTRYRRLHQTIGDFGERIRWAIAAMLQSPSFLYRSEVGDGGENGNYPLTPYEIATELSYFITGSMPDDILYAAAKSGELSNPEVLEREAKRLFNSPRARQTLSRFTDSWLELDRLAGVPKDAMTYPGFDDAHRAVLKAETESFVARVVYEGSGTFSGLLTELDGSPERAGILSQRSVLSVHARPNSSSPVHRGKLVRERLLCQKLPPPPPGVVVEPPALDPTSTGRERYARHSSDPGCSQCHRLIDPIGFAFEHFDGAGAFREMENGKEIDDRGEIAGSVSTDASFAGLAGLANVLAESDEVRTCFTEHWFRFAYGLTPDACTIRELRPANTDPKIEDLVVALATHPRIRARTGEAVVPPPEDPPPAEDPPPEPPVPEINVEIHEDSRWESGHCDQVTVTNHGTAPLDWSVTLAIEGTLTQHWNAQRSGDSGDVRFEGVSWNDVLAPLASASFGYCASH